MFFIPTLHVKVYSHVNVTMNANVDVTMPMLMWAQVATLLALMLVFEASPTLKAPAIAAQETGKCDGMAAMLQVLRRLSSLEPSEREISRVYPNL